MSAKPSAAPDNRHDPYDVEAEQHVLGLCLKDNVHIETLGEILAAEHFYDPMHGRIFAYMTMMRAEEPGRIISPVTLHAALRSDPGIKDLSISGYEYFAGMAAIAPHLSEVRVLAKILVDLSARRDLIRAAQDMLDAAHTPPHELTTSKILSRAQQDIGTVFTDWERSTGEAQAISMKDRSEAAVRSLEASKASGTAGPKVFTGLQTLDDITGGFQGGDFVVLAGRSGMGKSALAGCMATRAAEGAMTPLGYRAQPVPVLVFSYEMTGAQWAERAICDMDYDHHSRALHYKNFRTGRFDEKEMVRVAEAQVKLAALSNLEICEDSGLTVSQLAAKARAFKARHGSGMGLIAIDYLQKVIPDFQRDRSREQEVTSVASALKNLSKSLGWPVIALAQLLTKGSERGRDTFEHLPTLKDIRESGSIEIEADFVLGLFRKARAIQANKPEGALKGSPEMEEWEAERTKYQNHFQVRGLKNRHGEEFDLELWCDMGASAIRDGKPSSHFVRQPPIEELRF